MRWLTLCVSFASAAAWAEEAKLRSAFGPGEQSVYQLSYLGLPAGDFQVTVGMLMRRDDREVWPVLCVARSEIPVYRVNDKYVSYWDPHQRVNVGSDFWIDENQKKRREHVTLKHDEKRALVKRAVLGEPLHDVWYDINTQTVDVAGATLWLRNVPLKVGDKHSLPVFTGAVSFTMAAVVEEKTTIQTRKGPREVFKVRVSTEFEGQLRQKRDLVAYMSADPYQVPVRVEADLLLGVVVAELIQFEPGRDFTNG